MNFSLVETKKRKVTKKPDGSYIISQKIKTGKIKTYNRFVIEDQSLFVQKLKRIMSYLQGSFFRYNVPNQIKHFSYFLSPGPLSLKGIKGKKIVDIGCSGGNFLMSLPSEWKKYGVEINREACKIARGNGIKAECSDFENSKGRIKFDVVRASHVIEHSRNPEKFVLKLKQIAGDRCRLLIYTPNGNSFSRKIFGKYWEGFYDETHFNIFNNVSLHKLMGKYGFRKRRIDTYYMGYTAASLLRSLHLEKSKIFTPLFMTLYILFYPLGLLRFINGKVFSGGGLYLEYTKK